MNILFISNGLNIDSYPLIGLFEFDQAKAISNMGHKVTIFGIDMRSIRRWRKWGIQYGMREGIEWYTINFPLGRVKIKFLCKIGYLLLEQLSKRVMLDKPDLIHAHFTIMGHIGASYAEKHKIPLVITEHSSLMNNPTIKSDLLNCADEAYGKADGVIAVSSTLARNIYKFTNISCEIIPNVIDGYAFFDSNRKYHTGFGYITTCNLISHKRPELLMRAFSNVYKEHSDVFLGYIGDGKLMRRLRSLSKKLGIENRVKFYGVKSREEIAKIYQYYDCFALPSLKETFGVAYIEAMAAGLPVIATKCGGPDDFVNEKNGIMIPVDDEMALYRAMNEMYLTSSKFDSEYIRMFVKNKYSDHAVAKKIIRYYEKILSKA